MKTRLLSIALLLALPGASVAQDDPARTPDAAAARAELDELRAQMRELSRRMAALSTELGESGPSAYAMRYLGSPGRAFAGLVLSEGGDGVAIEAVTPNGPAARAGLLAGDAIIAVNGEPIDAGTPSARLAQARERLAGLEDGEEVRIRYRRGSATHAIAFKAERREAMTWPMAIGNDDVLTKEQRERIERAMEKVRGIDVEGIRRAVGEHAARAGEEAGQAFRSGMPWWGLSLAPLNPELGRYFGAEQGALVLAADSHSLPGLEGGDVITGVAGKPVERPGDVLRALRDQPAEKDVRIDVLRERKPVTLSLRVPTFKTIFDLAPPVPPVPPAPPAPPAAPAAPAAKPPSMM